MECEDHIANIIEYVLVGFAVFETMLSYTPDGYPKSTVQGVIMGVIGVCNRMRRILYRKDEGVIDDGLVEINI